LPESKVLFELEKLLSPLDSEARQAVMLAVDENWKAPPMTRWTLPDDEIGGTFAGRVPGITGGDSNAFTIARIEQMMSTGQIAYPMALKKAPITSIVRSPSGFTVQCADERMSRLMRASLGKVLAKRIEEVLTFLEYGAFYGEATFDIGWPQDYGLSKSTTPFWFLGDLNGCHPSTIAKINRDPETLSFQGFTQEPVAPGQIEGIEIGLDRALVIPNKGTFGKLEGVSELEPVYVWWFWYEMIWRSFLRFLQRTGTGVVIVKAPSRGRVLVQGKNIDNMAWALQMASSLHRTNYAALPSDMNRDSNQPLWAVDLLKTGQNEGKPFMEALTLLGDNIKNFLLTGNAGAADGGEFEVMLDTERVLSHIGVYISEYLLPKWLMWNGSKARVATLDFQGANSRVLPLLFKLMAVAGNTAGDYLQNVDWRLLFAKGGVPILDEKEVERLAQERQAQGAAKETVRETARMQPGGEGRWDSQRNKEGEFPQLSDKELDALAVRLHNRDMISEAFRVPIIALSAPQVATLESIGARAQAGSIKLFNPYHDTAGLFTSKEYAVAIKKHVDQVSSDMGIARPKMSYFDNSDEYAKAVCESRNLGGSCQKSVKKSLAAAYRGRVYVGPRAIRAYDKDAPGGKYIVTHEMLHTRKRADGSLGLDIDKYKTKRGQYIATWAEEGCTDLLARRYSGLGSKTKAGGYNILYQKYMGAMALLALTVADNNKDKAWDIIDNIHYNINDTTTLQKYLSMAFGTPRGGWTEEKAYAALWYLQKHRHRNRALDYLLEVGE